MKRSLLILAFFLAALSGFGQGKVEFSNDSQHLVYWNPDPVYSPVGLAGQIFNPSNAPGTFVADLYMGTSSGSLSLYSTTVFSSLTPGRWVPAQVIAATPFIAPGSTVFTMIQVRDAAFTPPSTLNPSNIPAYPIGTYFGYSVEFTFTLGGSITYPPLTGSNGNWPPGNYPLPPYGNGAIMLTSIPEPGMGALASVLILVVRLRRRSRPVCVLRF